jgi:hypothetical protein
LTNKTLIEDSTSDLLTTEQVMDILIADANLRRRAATCVLPAVRVGGLTYFRRSDLDAWRDREQSAQ